MITSGTVSMPNGLRGKFVTYLKDGGKILNKVSFQAQGMDMEVLQGCDGDRCYSKDMMMGTRLLEGQELDQFKVTNDIRSAADWRKYFTKQEYQGKETFQEKEVHKVYLETQQGISMVNYYDAETYLTLKSEMTVSGPMGTVKPIVVYGPYEEHNGMKFAKTNTMQLMGQEISMSIDAIELDVDIPDSKFALPEGL
jgi:hypothetical protein